MTDNEIIKALEQSSNYDCELCEVKDEDCQYSCEGFMADSILDLIKRQKAEIRMARTEAIKEFAEMLKTKNEDFCVDKGDMAFCVDNLVKEFMEGKNERTIM